MRPTISALRGWRLDELIAAAAIATANAQAITNAAGMIDRALLSTSTWSGRGQQAAKRTIAANADHAAEVCAVLHALASTAANANRELVPARDLVLSEVSRILADGFDVSDTGEVGVPNGDDADDETCADREASAAIWQNRISTALSAIATLDDTYGRAFTAYAKDLADMVDGQRPITLPDGTRADPDAVVASLAAMTPAQRRAFLATLTADDIRQLIIADPHTMGNLDGIPFSTRISANDVNIRNALAQEITAGRGDGARARKLTEMLTPVQRIGPTFGDTTPVRRQFVAFANTKVGHTIEMVGDLDNSTRNAVVYVPGTNSNLNGSRSNYESALNLSARTGGPVFMYLDERLPQKMGHEGVLAGAPLAAVPAAAPIGAVRAVLGLTDSAADTGPAKDIAPGLVSFGRELDTELNRIAPTAKTTFIGHSYGGAVVGTAEQLGLRADRVIYASSAGTGALNTGWHNANPNVERYSLTAPGDWIHTAQQTGRLGTDPDTAPGVARLDTGYYSPGGTHHGQLITGQNGGHGGYWDDPDSTGFQNMVSVIVGDTPTEYVARIPDTPEAQTASFDAARIAATTAGFVPLLGVETLRRWLSSD
ncbi:hypothetical protein GOEFS_092_00430 [Gordonia effusa NBRC 100432]|uniref:DUF1023 domain-containing protein n=1 Tax=Gordonia effusa NBRC 100432 TaxID=1077974 RepID=H0R3G7_9ACTN|nr:alpha/beta hydrolase [Gordonia effusa]GAB19618.1 hypothetical protein GOEFS_092_00430 [Gordonia effusa NBRC 100432]